MAYQPSLVKDFPNQATASGAIIATPIYSVTNAGLHRVAIYIAPMTAATIVGSVTATIGWVDGGIARSWQSSALSLLSLGGIVQAIIPVRCDANTTITYALSVLGTTGTYTASFGVRPPV